MAEEKTTDSAIPVIAPLTRTPSEQAMSISAALRQAAIDVPRDLPPGLHLGASVTEQEARMVVTVCAKDAYGVAAWEQRYDGTGRRLTVGVGITF